MNDPMDGSMNDPTDCPMAGSMNDPTDGPKADPTNGSNGRPAHSSYKYHFAKNRQTGIRRRDRARPSPIIHQK
ncbi:hypothetical protein [Thalassospira lucentensis]|uniref:hypothetical protein n=1 Tax=Thalassospira lucentensis TaxID=168935 RepID=UPI003D2C238F